MPVLPTIHAPKGELTLESVEDLEAELVLLVSRPGARLILDLADVAIISTPGIGLLLELHRVARQNGGKFVTARPTPHVRDVIRRTQLERVLTITDSLDEATALAAAEP